jgi:hypothetical protein
VEVFAFLKSSSEDYSLSASGDFGERGRAVLDCTSTVVTLFLLKSEFLPTPTLLSGLPILTTNFSMKIFDF